MKRNIIIGVGIIVVLGLAIGLYFGLKPPDEKEPTIKIGYLNIVASLPLFVAEEKGFLEQEGIEYEAIPTASSNQLVDGIVAGNLDCFIESSAVPVLALELQSPDKLKVFSVSEITPQTPFDTLLVKENSTIKTLSDVSGKRIGVFPGSTATNLLKKYLTDKGINISGTTFVPMPPQNHLTALLRGSVDVIHAYEPTTAIALTKGGFRQLYGSVYADMISPNPQGVAVVSKVFLERHPQVAEKVIRAFEKAMTFMKEHDAETRNILISRMKLPEDAAKRCVFLYMLHHDQIQVDVFQRYADMLAELGEIGGHVRVDRLVLK